MATQPVNGKICKSSRMEKTQVVSKPPRGKPRGINTPSSRVQAALFPCLLSPVAQYILMICSLTPTVETKYPSDHIPSTPN
ncbi:MAG: hypothetical protein AB8B66_00740 [Rickettsiaceae bacterium]